jgi:hypothetical protein
MATPEFRQEPLLCCMRYIVGVNRNTNIGSIGTDQRANYRLADPNLPL